MMEMEGGLAGALCTDVLGDLVNVVHQADGIAESIGVHVLHQERLGIAIGENEIHLIGAVYVAHLDGLIPHIFIIDPEELAHFLQFLIQIHVLIPLICNRCLCSMVHGNVLIVNDSVLFVNKRRKYWHYAPIEKKISRFFLRTCSKRTNPADISVCRAG